MRCNYCAAQRAAHPFLVIIIIIIVVVLVVVCGGQLEKEELYSSVSKMKTLPIVEKQLLEKFEEVLLSLPETEGILVMRKKIEKLKRVNWKYLRNVSMMENPFHAFRLIKRMVKQWSPVFRASTKLAESSRASFKGSIPEFFTSTREWLSRHGISWPTALDLSGAAAALVRLHHIYDLHYPTLVQGRFLNMTSPPMTPVELTYVTRAAVDLGYICDAKQLFAALEEAMGWRTRGEREEREKEEGGRGEEGGGGGAETEGERGSGLKHLRKRFHKLAIGTTTECASNGSFSHSNPTIESLSSVPAQARRDAVLSIYHQICRQSKQTAVMYGSGTRCYWQSTHIPYLRFKADVVNSDPFIVIFRDVISDREIEEMKELSYGKIVPSSLAVEQVKHEKHLIRVSQNTWLMDSSPIMSRLSRRVHHVTGLSTRILAEDTHAEPYQVLNYGLGGMHGPHEDSVRIPRLQGRENVPHLKRAGDRTATWMYYLSDVPLGGATVFPLLGAAIRPQKDVRHQKKEVLTSMMMTNVQGTAVFWYNLKRSGQADTRTVHAGCPVLYGDKWVANKWLREVGNIFTRPCLLDPGL